MTTSVAERLARNSFTLDEEEPHITIDQEAARRTGAGLILETICPAHVYTARPDGSLIVEYAACLECGTCRVFAPAGVLTWHYPRGTFGIAFREG